MQPRLTHRVTTSATPFPEISKLRHREFESIVRIHTDASKNQCLSSRSLARTFQVTGIKHLGSGKQKQTKLKLSEKGPGYHLKNKGQSL